MDERKIVIAVYPSAEDADDALARLRALGVDPSSTSLLRKCSQLDDQPSAYYSLGMHERHYYGRNANFWDAHWQQLASAAHVLIPGTGALVAAGFFSQSLIAELRQGSPESPRSPLVAAFMEVGAPRDAAERYASAIAADQVVVVVQSDGEVANRAFQAIEMSRRIESQLYRLGCFVDPNLTNARSDPPAHVWNREGSA